MVQENLFHLLAVVLVVTAVSISVSFRMRANRSGDRISPVTEEGRVLYSLRVVFGLALWLGVLAYLINPGWMAWAQVELPIWLRWTGAAVMAACLPLIYWIFSSLGKNVTPTTAIRKAHTLVKHGPYRWVRHPLYSVGLLFFLGFSLLAANWFLAFTLPGAFVVLALRTPLEEARLIEAFGDEYREYMQTTGRFLPRFM
jgi:protein-S-isoprenylcysteine O-methyltransferase Ste14